MTEIATLIQRWASAVQRQDLAAVVADHAEDMVMFDVPLPNRLDGIDAYRESWRPFFDYAGDDGHFDIETLDVAEGDTVAYATALLRCGRSAELAADPETRLRLTVGLRREGGRWKIAHEHHSYPQKPA